ncbi:MAG: AAA family ATPase [Fibrobacter sp.]|nr:AAA family ATPase [Fibrobacter sp.]
MQRKEHAKDYLIDYAQNKVSDSWLKILIYEIVLSNGNIDAKKLDELYSLLVNDAPMEVPTLTNSCEPQNRELRFQSLKHISGVSALINNQTIKFCDNVTIMYGLNGSGKSSYFRIMNEIVGGNQKKEILPNIYADSPEPISVEFFYKIGNSEKNIQWDNTQRAFADLVNTKVFDSSYLNSFLNSHVVDQSVIQPFGLHLFEAVIKKTDELKQLLQIDIKKLQGQELSLSINTEKFSNGIKECFSSKQNASELKDTILNMTFSDEDSEKKNAVEEKIKHLNSDNLEDKIRVLDALKKKYQKMQVDLCEIQSKLLDFSNKASEILLNKNNAIDAAEKVKDKILLLKDIPGNKSIEWKKFIEDGTRYSVANSINGICPYCRQRLQSDAEKLIQAYISYLNDKTQERLSAAENAFNSFKDSVIRINPSIEIDELVEKDLTERSFVSELKKFIEKLQEQKDNILQFIEGKKSEVINVNIDITSILFFFKKRNADIASNLESYNKNKEERNDEIKRLEIRLKELEEKQSISAQKKKIEKWFELYEKERKLENKCSSIKTKPLSMLASTAYNELVSDKLIQNFGEMLSTIVGLSGIDVSLKPVSVNKGVAKTQLVLTKENEIHKILSEGEQKAVGLALFFAEIKTQASNSPIILDDPVNSLDHKIASNLAELILSLDNQVVIFSHNRLFVDAFECSKNNHVCKTMDTACCNTKGKHIRIYSVSSEGKNCKGALRNYKGTRMANYIESARRGLQKMPFISEKDVASDLRLAIECFVDEKILNNIVPTKFSNKNSRINWEDLKKVGAEESVINSLYQMHSRLSGGNLHNGSELLENPIEKEELEGILQKVEQML